MKVRNANLARKHLALRGVVSCDIETHFVSSLLLPFQYKTPAEAVRT